MINLILIAITTFFLTRALWLTLKGFAGYNSKGEYSGFSYAFSFFLTIIFWWTVICGVLWLLGFDTF